MSKSLNELLSEFQMKKGFFHSERHVYGGDPKSQSGYTVSVPDNIPKEELPAVISLEQQRALDDICQTVKKNYTELLYEQRQMNKHLKMLKAFGIFLMVMLGIIIFLLFLVLITSVSPK